MSRNIDFGLDTFGDSATSDDGAQISQAQVIRDVVEQEVLADEVGVDYFRLGEHHRDDFAVSTPEVVLAAIAPRTAHIRVGTTVAVLRSDDPVRVCERFANLDAPSTGLAVITIGRGSSPSHSRCSAITSRTTKFCSKKSWTCSPPCVMRVR